MPLSSNPIAPRRFVNGGPAPFASLSPVAHEGRSWLMHLLFSPFRDLDERVRYKSAQRRDPAANGSGRWRDRAISQAPANGAAVGSAG